MKKYLMLLWVLTVSSFVYGDNNAIDVFYNVYHSSSDQKKVNAAFEKLQASDPGTSKEYSLYLKGFITSTKFYNQKAPVSPAEIAKLKKVYLQLQQYAEEVGKNDLSSAFLTILADIRIQVMKYETMQELIKMSAESKKDYELAIKLDPENFHAYLGLGQWYYYAPKIGGGNMKKSLEYYKLAENKAKKSYQKYLVFIWRSQVNFKNNKKKEATADLSKAAQIFPEGDFCKDVKALNDKGKAI